MRNQPFAKVPGLYVDPSQMDFGAPMIVRPMPLPPQAQYTGTFVAPKMFDKKAPTTPTVQVIYGAPVNRVTI